MPTGSTSQIRDEVTLAFGYDLSRTVDGIPPAIRAQARTYLPADMIEVLGRFEAVTRQGRA